MEQYDIERYLNIRSAGGADFGPTGQLSFLYDATGTPQLWSLDEPGAWPEQLTFFDERVTFADFSPERPELVFGMDEGGNERVQFYRLNRPTGSITDLTQRPGAKHRWGGWDSDGDRFAFTSNRRNEAVFDVYVQDREGVGADAERVHEGDGWLSVAGWSPSDDRLLVVEAHSSFDQDLYALDLESRDLRHLTPHDGDVRFGSAEWGPDGESVYTVTDRATDTLQLERLDLESGAFSVVEAGSEERSSSGSRAEPGDGDWNVDGVAIDEDSRRIVYTRNVDGYTAVTVGELVGADRIDETATPDLPEGVLGGVSFDDDGDRFAISGSGSTTNGNVYVIDARTGKTERWTSAATAGIPTDTFVEPELVHYPTFDVDDRSSSARETESRGGLEIPAFFSVPDVEPPEGGYPVVVDIHGGPESQRRPSFSPVTQYLLNHGYAVFEPNVRGSSGYGKEYSSLDDVRNRMDSVADIEAAVEWLHDHPEVDPDRIVAQGGSYGGFMVLAALTEYPDLWAAGVDIVGIANFVTFLENTGDWRRALREAEYGSLEEDRAFLEEISPINNIEAIEAPLFVLHGENDPRVPVGEAEQIVEKAREQGVSVRKLIFPDEGHGFAKLENRIEAYRAIVDFLEEYV